jgi:hypothetical protein
MTSANLIRLLHLTVFTCSSLDRFIPSSPSGRFVAAYPLILFVSKLFLDLLHGALVSGILTNVIAMEKSVTTIGKGVVEAQRRSRPT